MSKTNDFNLTKQELTRRTVLKGAAIGTGVLVASDVLGLFRMKSAEAAHTALSLRHDPPYGDSTVKTIRTACMMCNAGCGLQVRVKGGQAIKIEGNPFCPHTNDWSAATKPTIAQADSNPGRICGRGNGGLKTTYDPFRIMHPLKRVGPRGSGQWERISWKQAFDELAEGGALHTPTGGSTYNFDGLRTIRGTTTDATQGTITVKTATEKLAATDTAYATEAKSGDPGNYGLKANRYVWLRGRDQISSITSRFNNSYGTKNHLEHSSICNTAWAKMMNHNFAQPTTASYKYHRVELDNVEYLILMGSNPLEANVGTPFWARKLTDLKARGGKLVVVDPYFTHTAAKADVWVPIKPGFDGALVLGMIRWIIENNRHLADYLARPNATAAEQGSTKYYNCSDASCLIELDSAGEPEEYLSSKAAGLTTTTITADITSSATSIPVAELSGLAGKGLIKIGSEIIYYDGKSATSGAGTLTVVKRGSLNTSAAAATSGAEVFVPLVCREGSSTVHYSSVAATAELDWEGTVNGKTCKTVFRLIKEAANAKTLDQWANLAGVTKATLVSLATDLSDPAKKTCLETYRGFWCHTNGFASGLAAHAINVILGRVDRVGGYATGPRYGSKEPDRGLTVSQSGIRIDRVGSKYEGTASTPTRQWFPLAGQNSQDVIPSAAYVGPGKTVSGYPYKVLAFTHYCSNPAYTYTNSQAQRDALVRVDPADSSRYAIPLTFSVTLFMDETAALADYVLPDSSYLERYSTPFTGYPTVKTKSGTIRRPVIGSYREITVNGRAARIYIPPTSTLNGNTFADQDALLAAWVGPMPYDEQLIQLGKKLNLPNFGADAMGTGKALDTAWQFWDAGFKKGDLTDLGNEGASGEPGDSTNTYMQEGGRWDDPSVIEDPAKPGWVKNRYGDLITLWSDKASHYTDALTGHHYPTYAQWEEPGETLKGNQQSWPGGYDYTMLTHKRAWQTQSRTTSNEWLRELQPEGFVYIAAADAANLGISSGDRVKLSNHQGRATEGKARVIQGIRPGCVMVDHHFGRGWFGSSPILVSGNPQPFDRAIGVGPNRNLVQAGDNDFPDVGLTERVSGQAVFYWDKVKVEKA